MVFGAMVLLVGLEELTNIRNIERLKKELRVSLQDGHEDGKLGYLVTDIWELHFPESPGADLPCGFLGCLVV